MVYYDGYEIDEDGMVFECPICGNSEFNKGDIHCSVCGFLAYNKCLNLHPNIHCDHINPGNARFCVKCGYMTHFSESGILKDWIDAREAILNKMLLEFRIRNSSITVPYIADWSYILLALNKKEYELLIMCLEGSKGKIISDTLLIYVKDPFIKRVLKTKDLFDNMVDNIREHLDLEFSKVIILSPEDDLNDIEIIEAEIYIPF